MTSDAHTPIDNIWELLDEADGDSSGAKDAYEAVSRVFDEEMTSRDLSVSDAACVVAALVFNFLDSAASTGGTFQEHWSGLLLVMKSATEEDYDEKQ